MAGKIDGQNCYETRWPALFPDGGVGLTQRIIPNGRVFRISNRVSLGLHSVVVQQDGVGREETIFKSVV